MMIYPKDASSSQRIALQKLERTLGSLSAARVGETSVVSTKVHIQDMRKPSQVVAILDQDAGRVFYGREEPDEIIHLDVFHAEGAVRPKEVADSIGAVLLGTTLEGEGNSRGVPGAIPSSLVSFMSYVDIQTGLGGGRLDGSLTYGQEKKVLKSHRTHVHVTALNTPEIRGVIPNIVAAVESSIGRCGLELRKVEKILAAKGKEPLDISDYRATSDSLLKNLDSKDMSKSSWPFYQEALARQAAKNAGSAEEARKILEALKWGLRSHDFQKFGAKQDKSSDEVRKSLLQSKLVRFDGQKYTLTKEGEMALSFLKERTLEVDLYLKRLLWSLPSRTAPKGERRTPKLQGKETRGRGIIMARIPGQPPAQIAVVETLFASGLRQLSEARENSFSPPQTFSPRVIHEDLRFLYSRERRSSPLLLLIDASASMAGKRLAAAKELAKHLVVAGKDKVAVVVFQDGDAHLVSDFTKNLKSLEKGLSKIEAQGLTPLARGLEISQELSERFVRKPLVLCITDGIPTVPSKSLSPIDDALDAARSLSRKRIHFGCIGLEPNRGFLKEMVKEARGSLYIVDELEAKSLSAIAKKESAD